MRQRRRSKSEDSVWFLILIVVGLLFLCLLISPYLRFQLGGKWSLPLIGLAFLIVLYLQPPVARWLHQWRADRRDAAEKRWWRERDIREQQAQLRAEALRLGKISRDDKK
jgi:hypothetical protein